MHSYNSVLMGILDLISDITGGLCVAHWTLDILVVFDAKLSLSGFVCYVLSDYCEYHLSDKNNPPPSNTDQYNLVTSQPGI